MVRLKLILAYSGTHFHGWQIQEYKTLNRPRTVQECVEDAAAHILGHPVRVQGAGRTDSGVHAQGQVAHLDIPDEKSDLDWQTALNANLPHDVAVLDAECVSPDFHARFQVREKLYVYSLWLSRRYVLPQRRDFVWPVGPVDIAAMDEAACLLTGTHDFAGFRNQGTETGTTVRTVLEISHTDPGDTLEMVWSFRAEGFLKQMVRNLMGCLVAVGKGKLEPNDVIAIFESKDRTTAPATAPAKGLTLQSVQY